MMRILFIFLILLLLVSCTPEDRSVINRTVSRDEASDVRTEHSDDSDIRTTSGYESDIAGVVEVIPYCGWVEADYDMINHNEYKYETLDESENNGIFYTVSGEMRVYDDGSADIVINKVNFYADYNYYSFEEFTDGSTIKKQAGPIALNVDGNAEDLVLGFVDPEGYYELDLSPGYITEDLSYSITGTREYTSAEGEKQVETTDVALEVFGFSIGGDEDNCEDSSDKSLTMNAKCRYQMDSNGILFGEYLDTTSSSGIQEEYNLRWVMKPVGGSLESLKNPELMNDAITDMSLDTVDEYSDLEVWLSESSNC